MTVAYLAHSLGESDMDWGNTRSDNISNAIEWFRFLRRATRWAICYPAMAYVAADTSLQRPSMIAGMVEIMLACDVVVLTGGHRSPHMRVEMDAAADRSRPVIDLLHYGRSPPWENADVVAQEITRRADELDL